MGKKAEIERDSDRVIITIRCNEIYEAMQLYDELIEALRSGRMTLTVDTSPLVAERSFPDAA